MIDRKCYKKLEKKKNKNWKNNKMKKEFFG